MNKTFLIEFIEEYKKFPCLWRIKSEEYRDRNLKNKAYEHLLNKMREVEADATIQMVKNKIDSMRGCFRKELKKIKDSQRSGAGGEDVYIPHLWYFKNLIFLKDQETPREGISSMDFTDDTVVYLNYYFIKKFEFHFKVTYKVFYYINDCIQFILLKPKFSGIIDLRVYAFYYGYFNNGFYLIFLDGFASRKS